MGTASRLKGAPNPHVPHLNLDFEVIHVEILKLGDGRRDRMQAATIGEE
jgi:hypothetical protein